MGKFKGNLLYIDILNTQRRYRLRVRICGSQFLSCLSRPQEAVSFIPSCARAKILISVDDSPRHIFQIKFPGKKSLRNNLERVHGAMANRVVSILLERFDMTIMTIY